MPHLELSPDGGLVFGATIITELLDRRLQGDLERGTSFVREAAQRGSNMVCAG